MAKKAAIIVAVAKPKEPELTIPKGLDLDGKSDGDVVQIVLRAKIEDGKLIPITLDGVPISGGEMGQGEEEGEAEPDNEQGEEEQKPGTGATNEPSNFKDMLDSMAQGANSPKPPTV